jgi:hypothetical protein
VKRLDLKGSRRGVKKKAAESVRRGFRLPEEGPRPKAAEENNAENLLVIPDKKLAERYIKNWLYRAEHSKVY